ncbi:hypothetical protein BA177_10945 [Woeseia oceani]|uniref:Uncharacterized protein n=1 Tax=Woeseia oceani TaxID=1548547 RepID=A0A193LGR3_9GAMM|nr:hypothetical protein BA177_10945 [Woeseia oceani]
MPALFLFASLPMAVLTAQLCIDHMMSVFFPRYRGKGIKHFSSYCFLYLFKVGLVLALSIASQPDTLAQQ